MVRTCWRREECWRNSGTPDSMMDMSCTMLVSLATVLLTAHSNGTHKQTTGQPATQATAKVPRPTILSAGSSEEWSFFLARWKDYTEATKLEGKDMVIQLRKCCGGKTLKRPHKERRRFTHHQIGGRKATSFICFSLKKATPFTYQL